MIYLVGEDGRSVPDWFRRGLRNIDSALVCYYNRFQNQFCIDRCVHGSDCQAADHVSCQKTSVHIFEHMSETVLDTIRGMDAWTKYGDSGELGLLRQRKERENAKAEWDAKAQEDSKAVWRDGFRDDRVQVNKLVHLLQQHDVARVHK
jgi:hypothetical protein